jgi:hypothetical protein
MFLAALRGALPQEEVSSMSIAYRYVDQTEAELGIQPGRNNTSRKWSVNPVDSEVTNQRQDMLHMLFNTPLGSRRLLVLFAPRLRRQRRAVPRSNP